MDYSKNNSKRGIWSIENAFQRVSGQDWQYAGDVTEPGTLWTWGRGGSGRLGIQEGDCNKSSPMQIPGSQWTQATVGQYSSAALKSDGTLWTWGNVNGLGINASGDRSSPVQVPGTNWTCVSSAQGRFVLALKSDNTLWAWGCNAQGQLADGTTIEKSSPIQIPGTQWSQLGGSHVTPAAIKTDGTLWTWGYGPYGMIGNGLDSINRCSPVQIPGNQWTDIGCSWFQIHARKSDGTLWGWGRNFYGGLGVSLPVGSFSSPAQIPGNQWVEAARGGTTHGLARKIDGTLWTWGFNNFGQLGVNSICCIPSPIQVGGIWTKISASHENSYGIKSDGSLWVWGRATYGVTADNQIVICRSSPTQLPGKWSDVRGGCHHVLARKTI